MMPYGLDPHVAADRTAPKFRHQLLPTVWYCARDLQLQTLPSTLLRGRCGLFTLNPLHSRSIVDKVPARSVPLHTNSLVARASSARNQKLKSLALPRSLLNWNKPHIWFHRFPTARKLTPNICSDYCMKPYNIKVPKCAINSILSQMC